MPRNAYHTAYLDTRGADLVARYMARDLLVSRYAWAIPNEEAIELLVGLGPLVEIGAGSGYWASLIREAGGDIVAYDVEPWSNLHTEVEEGGPEYAGAHHDRTLLLCWPPYEASMAYDALYGYLEMGGRQVVYVGERSGGCTGDDAFHDLLGTRLDCHKRVSIPQWPGIHDTMTLWVRRD